MKKTVGLLAVIYSLLITGCISTAPFDQQAYQTAVDLKVDSLALMDEAVTPYTNHVPETDALMLRIHKAYEYPESVSRQFAPRVSISRGLFRESFGVLHRPSESFYRVDGAVL